MANNQIYQEQKSYVKEAQVEVHQAYQAQIVDNTSATSFPNVVQNEDNVPNDSFYEVDET